MKTSEYLYGCDIKYLPSMDEGLTYRIKASEALLQNLLNTPLEDRDWTRISAIIKAISHNNKILKGAI